MKRFRMLAGLLVGAAMLVPMGLAADDHDGDRDRSHDRRYSDRDHHDYHAWDDHEDRAYRVYLGEQHREYRDFHRVNGARQREYFRWRHEHPDSSLFNVEIR